MIIDISPPLHAGLAPWPGDEPFNLQWGFRQADGANVNLSAMCCSVHIGAHADAPFHFDSQAATIEELDLEPFLGPACVVDVPGEGEVTAQRLLAGWTDGSPRLLLRTGAWPDRSVFPAAIPVLSAGVPEWLQSLGVLLLGVDLPSVDAIESVELPIHHALGRAGIAILEGLDLSHVEPGTYELSALPLRIRGADGSPVRAVLRR